MRIASITALTLSLCAASCSRPEEPVKPDSPKPAAAPKVATGRSAAELDPAKMTEKAPDVFKATFTTSKGDIVIEVHREWAPNGADRFYNLAKSGYYDETRFFRAIEGFMVQFGVHGDPAVTRAWTSSRIPDDPVKESNKRGYVTFAMAGPNSRTTQIFINLVDNVRLDGMKFAPFAKVVEGMDVVDKLYKGYGESQPSGKGPSQGRLTTEGNAYLAKEFPQLDWVKSVKVK